MKTFDRIPSGAILAVAAALVLCGAGCASADYRKSDAAARSLHLAAGKIQAESGALDGAMTALDDLIDKPGADLRPQFARFSVALKRLNRAQAQNEKAAARADRKVTQYLRDWNQSLQAISYGQIRAQSESRKAEVVGQFNRVHQQFAQDQSVVRPLIAYLEDIRTALSADLTAGGIASVRAAAADARQNAAKVDKALGRLAQNMYVAGTQLSSFGQAGQSPAAEGAAQEPAAENQVTFSSRMRHD